MSESADFRPIESAPARRLWPYAILGAVIVGLVVYIARQNVRAAEPKQVAVASLAPKLPDPVKEAAKAEPAAAVQKAPESPNVLGAAASAAGKLAMVAKAELD